ncbi:MAG: hypothetical protein JXQ67_06235 [Campylobacterales bacterium]|nr:hypothetical protein [Campylobacterales bacterium]
MRKKALIASLCMVASLAEADDKGIFVGVDFSSTSSPLKYVNSGNMPLYSYDNSYTDTRYSLKVGYQAYFTRIYARYSTFEYKDEKRDKFSITDGALYELNAEYIPLFYANESKEWAVRGLFGLGCGYNSSKLTEYDSYLLPAGESASGAQNYMEYGYQLGLILESSYGVSVEVGYRARYGNLQEFSDGANDAVFSVDTTEFYLGVNYLF